MEALNKKFLSKLSEVRKKAKEYGIYIGDRELLKCGKCGLTEDVAATGELMTYFNNMNKNERINDTGLKFIETEEKGIFICPNCGSRVEEDEEDPLLEDE